MKAVYEMPKVSFEAFMADNAVMSACGYKFDCVRHGDEDDDDYELNEIEVDCEPDPNAKVVANVLGMSGCNNNAGFADLVNRNHANDTAIWDDNVWGLSKGLNEDDDIMNSTKWEKKGQSFLGWLYITFKGGEYSTAGWGTVNKDGKSFLNFKKGDGWGDNWHAWLTPIFSVKSTSGM